ncbi:MAG TPA: pantoate--beta-alanine ligase [Stellaceae bacterium]|nr:pantoate--beta-alanine ligase [Stellaceae bacterium]
MAAHAKEKIGTLPVVRSVAALRHEVSRWRNAGKTVALVPTMGALHAGHLALVERGRALSDRVIASLFVNPAQFAPHEDFARYPRDEASDAAKLAAARTDLLYAPPLEEIYPPGFATIVDVGAIAAGQDGHFRPGHFRGVATVVAKLLLQARPDIACFGEKDYQQLQVVKRLVRDLDIPVRIEGVATVREPDGLALSSRNLYLSPAERAVAPALYRVLGETAARLEAGEAAAPALADAATALMRAGFAKIDYVEACDALTLATLERADRPGRLLAAAWLGKTRLIDNVPVASAAGASQR